MADMTLPALPEESFQRALCVVAHPDDMEYGTSAAVARWTARGIEVGYLLLTRGADGMLVYGLDLRRDICREIRRFKPDLVFGSGFEVETPYGFDQADHRAAGL